jgi:hypothetical protein
MEKKIFIGKVREDFKGNERNYVSGEKLFITQHSWDCDWYWGFGYIGNKDLHTHFDSTFLGGAEAYDVEKVFETPVLTSKEWWLVRDLFVQAYALKGAAEVYRHGGYQTSMKGVTDIIKDDEMCTRLNADLQAVLDKVWSIFEQADERRRNPKKETAVDVPVLY